MDIFVAWRLVNCAGCPAPCLGSVRNLYQVLVRICRIYDPPEVFLIRYGRGFCSHLQLISKS